MPTLAFLGWSAIAAVASVVLSLAGGANGLGVGGTPATAARWMAAALPGDCPAPPGSPTIAPSPPPPLAPGPSEFAPGACARVDAHVRATLVGQDLALRQLADAVCDHVANPNPSKPLVLSAHGPPGVGKTLAHGLVAAA